MYQDLITLDPAFLRALGEQTVDGILVLGKDSEPVFYNNRYFELWGLDESFMEPGCGVQRRKQMSLLAVNPNEFVLGTQAIVDNPTNPVQTEVKLRSGRTYDCHITPVIDDHGNFHGQLVTYRDITEHRTAELQRNYLARHDKITGLLNRSAMFQLIENAISESTQTGVGFGLISFDLTRYRRINNRYGHLFGDLVLSVLAEKLHFSLAPSTISRYGEDEFLILVPAPTPGSLPGIITKINTILNSLNKIDGFEVELAASFGFAQYPKDGHTVAELIANTDIAMRKAQTLGSEQFVEYTEALGEEVAAQQNIESQLPQALENDCFALVYQPLVDVKNGQIVGCEALLRWDCQDQGSISPSDFLPFAEETGLIIPIGRWVLQTACEQALDWAHKGLGEIPVAVNVSAKQFSGSNFPQTVAEVLRGTGIRPELLEIELTETAFVQHMTSVSKAIDEIRSMGVRVSIDDFGTGYSSLKYLKHFKVDTLKIDRSFTQGIGVTGSDDALVTTAINMAHSLGLIALAEGVETAQQFDFLQAQNCDIAQGFLFSKPVSPHDFETLLLGETSADAYFITGKEPVGDSPSS